MHVPKPRKNIDLLFGESKKGNQSQLEQSLYMQSSLLCNSVLMNYSGAKSQRQNNQSKFQSI